MRQFVSDQQVMSKPSRSFRVRYWLQSLETRSSPLFSTVRAYLLTDSLKRLIAESSPIRDGKLSFRAEVEEEGRAVPADGRGGFGEARTTVLLEFGAEGRFIKMGEAHVNLGDVLNQGRNGELLPYRVEKCYDRNARITLGVTLSEAGARADRSEEGELHSRSQCQLPPARLKMRTVLNKHKVMATEYEQLTDREEKEEELSLVSDRHNSIGRTLNRTELLLRKPAHQPQEVLDLKTENRIYQHQLAQMEQRLREAEEVMQELQQQEEACRSEVCRLGAESDSLRAELHEREQLRESQREQLTAEVARMLRLYQESEQERNRMLLLREEEAGREKERLRESEKRTAEDRSRVKQLERSEESLKKRIEEYMAQIAIYDKALKAQQKTKQKTAQSLEAQLKANASLASQLQLARQACSKLTETNCELQSELEIGRFSLGELEKELSLLRRANKEAQGQLAHCEAELRLSGEAMRAERSNFTRRMQEIEQQTEREHRSMEAYLEELEIKTSKEETKNGLIGTLRKEVGRLKQELAGERERVEELEAEVGALSTSTKQTEGKMQEYQAKILSISRQNALLESEIKSRREREQAVPQIQASEGISEEEREDLIALCYQERDEVWKKELEAIESDTRTLMEKTKREKEEHARVAKKLNEDLVASEDLVKKSKAKVKELTEEEERLKKAVKQLENKCQHSERSNGELKLECSRYQQQMAELHKKLQLIAELEEALKEAEKKIAVNKHESESLKNNLQKEKQARARLRSDVKEVVTAAANYLGKSEKQRVFYEQLHCEHVDAELLLVFNSSCKLYCERHNRLKGKLEQLEDLRGQLESKEKEYEKINKSLREQRRSQGGSCDSASSIQRSESQATTGRAFQSIIAPLKSKEELEVRSLRKEVDELRNKLRKEGSRSSEMEREAERARRGLEESAEDLRRTREEAELRGEELAEVRERLKGKEKQLEVAREELKEMSKEVSSLKNELEEVSRAFKQEKSQTLKRSMVNRSFNSTRSGQDESFKTFELEKRLRQAQEELERLRREKEDRRGENSSQRQAKSFEARLKEKDEAMAALREGLEEEREKFEQAKQLQGLKLRKMKEQFEEELQLRVKAQKEMGQALNECEEKLRQVQKKLKITEQALRNANAQLLTSAEREEKARKMAAAEWELKLKTAQGELEAQIAGLNKRVDELRIAERTAKEGERRKEKEAAEARVEVERSERAVAELTERLELCGVRLKNMEEEESNYKEVIGALENKIKGESEEGRREREGDRDTFDNHSTFSLKTFTFR